jgi:formylglycine-generating enzyme required for sulfatase activity
MDRTIPMELVAICEKAMAREKSERYASMQELAEELRAYLGDRVVKAHRTGAFAELTKWVRRNRGMAAAIAAACLVAILGAVVSGIYARRATQSLDRFLQLADVVTLRELVAEADTLWPEVPEKVNAMADWLRRASELSLHRPQLEQALVDLRHRARALTATELEEARRRHPKAQELSESRKRLLQAEQNLPLPRDNEQEDLTEDDRLHGRALRAEVDRLKAAIAAMEGEIEATLRPRHAETGDQILYDTLERLVRDLRDLEDPELGVIASVVKRHTWASTVHQQTVVAENTAWREAIASIGNEAACPVYGGHKLKPQVGLVPLGRDRASGLWEFWHPRTGARPQRDEAGRYVVGDETGLLFVLIPGGTFWMGAQNRDAGARNHDPNAGREESPVHEVRLAPYFLAKYEMTQGQWGRVMGHYPSYYRLGTTMREHPVTLRNPVEHVDFDECAEIAQRLGLVLPTEAQWEHACRAGTDTVWHTGGTVESLSGSANLADEGSKGSYPAGWRYEPGFDDGHGVHAPVGSFLPNGFGLYDMHGNVWEWCRDEYGDYRTPPQREDGARVGDGSGMHVSRGGSFYFPASNARSAYRSRDLASRRGLHLGCRPAARVTP